MCNKKEFIWRADIVEIAGFLTVKGVQFGMQAHLPEAAAVILLTVQADHMINIAGLAGFLTAKDAPFGTRALLPAAAAAIGLLFEHRKW